MLKNLYDKCIALASHRLSKIYLAFFSFIESSVFPIPPDIMVVPMGIAKKTDYIKIFLITTIFSVLGGLFGYFLGYFFFEISISVIEFYGYEEKVFDLQNKISSKKGVLLWLGILFLAGFTPLPFKVFTITSGMIPLNIFIFVFVCLISRGLRFFLVSYFSMKYGEKFGNSLEKNGTLWSSLLGILVVILVAIIYFAFV